MKTCADNFPTPEQKAVIDSNSRITVVRACPGSGKTRVFVESLKMRIDSWTKKNAGIASISFTNVAQEQIAEGIGKHLPYPHFIGTLDAFALRYVVRPFGHLVGLPKEGHRLIPSPLDEAIEYPEVEIDSSGQKISLFSIRFADGPLHKPNMKAKTFRGQIDIEPDYTSNILKKKKAEWRKRGRITHSDCQYISSLILCHPEFGKKVSELVTRRFPMVLVDEFQDTNWFLGLALIELLRSPFRESGLVVGDPDQAIFEFGGANPDLFKDIENLPGAKSLPLNQTHRCPKKIAAIATALSDTGKQVLPRDNADQGSAIILVHDMEKIDRNKKVIANISKFCEEEDQLAIISRRELTLRTFLGESISSFRGVSHSGKNIENAVQMLRSDQSKVASHIVERELAWILFKNDSPSMNDLRDLDVDLIKWRRIIYQILKEASIDKKDETWNEWLLRIRKLILDSALDLNCEFDKRRISDNLKQNLKGNVLRKMAEHLESSDSLIERATIKTIHQVKGDEFECVVILVPKPSPNNSPCPSVEWWPDGPSEERRVAFVAASRAKKTLILCIHRDTYNALRTLRSDFVDNFEQIFLFERQHSLMEFL